MRRLLAYLLLAMIAVFPTRAQPSQILVPRQSWTLLGQGYQLTADSAVNKDGTVYFFRRTQQSDHENRSRWQDHHLDGGIPRYTRRRLRPRWPAVRGPARSQADRRF